MTDRALGADYSEWDNDVSTPQNVNFQKALANGITFSYIKASQNYADRDFLINWNNAKQAGMPRGAYHFLDWRTSELNQAKLFVGLLGNDPGELPPVVDFEMQDGAPEKAVCQGKLWNFVQYVEQAIGKKPMIYTGYFYWLEHTDANAGWEKYKLWLAWYADETVIKVPPPWKKWTFWQYTCQGDGIKYGAESKSLDMNVFNGTVAELKAFIGNSTPLPDPPIPVPDPNTQAATCNPNVRSFADSSSPANIIGMLTKGNRVIVDNIQPYWKHFIPMPGFPMGGWVWGAYLAPVS
jgi:lysozyme